MQIKERGNKIQLLRAEYSTEKKRTKQVAIGTLSRFSRPSLDVLDRLDLSEKEQDQVKAYYDKYEADARERRSQRTIRDAGLSIHSIAEEVEKVEMLTV